MILRTAVHVSWLLVAVAIAGLGYLLPVNGTTAFALDLSIGVFGGLVAAITFALALTIQQEQAWPSARSVVRDSGALAWLMVSLGSLALAVPGDLLGLTVADRCATASVGLSLISLLTGIWNVGGILSAAGGPGRRRSRVRILRHDLDASTKSPGKRLPVLVQREDTLNDFVVSFRRAVEAEDLAAIRAHSEEVIDASGSLGSDERPTIVATHLRMASILGGELVRGQLPLAASAAFQDLLEGAVDYAGHTLDSQRAQGPRDLATERRAVLILGGTTRLAAYFSKAIWQRYYQGQTQGGSAIEDEHASRILLTCHDVRERIRFAVDPDPPEKLLKAEDPWREGVADPESILLWLWANTDFDGTNQGSSLYSVYEVLMRDKYFGTTFGETSVLSDLRRAVLSTATPSSTRLVFEKYGGFDRVFLEVCTNSLAQLKPEGWSTPPQLSDNGYFDVNPRSRLRQFVSLEACENERPRDVDFAVDNLLHLLGPSSATFSAFALEQYETCDLGTLRPGRPVATRPPAAVLATALTLMSPTRHDEGAQRERLRKFLDGCPTSLLQATSAFAARILPPPSQTAIEDPIATVIEQLSKGWEG